LVQDEYQEEQAYEKRLHKNSNNKSKSLRQYLSNIAGKHKIKEIKKIAILGTAHTHTHTHTVENANVKVQNTFHGRMKMTYSTNYKSSSSSSYICHGGGPLVDPFQSHVSRSLFKGLP